MFIPTQEQGGHPALEARQAHVKPRRDVALASLPSSIQRKQICPRAKDTFLWEGAAGTWFWVDPTNDIVFVGMIQRMRGENPNVEYLSRSLVYQALVDPAN